MGIEQNMGEVNKIREVYQLVKSVNRKWQVKQSAIKDKEGKIIKDKEKAKQRWKEYCSELYKEDRQDNTEVVRELLNIAPPQLNVAQDNILYTEYRGREGSKATREEQKPRSGWSKSRDDKRRRRNTHKRNSQHV